LFLQFAEAVTNIELELRIIVKIGFTGIIKINCSVLERYTKMSHTHTHTHTHTHLLVLWTSYTAWALDLRRTSSANHAISESSRKQGITSRV